MKYRNTCTLKFAAALALASAALAADALPKGDAIMDKYVEVTGGKAAYAKLHSEISTGTMEFKAMGLKGKMTSYSAEPDKRYTEIVINGIGKMLEGSNGQVAWALSAVQGPRVKDGDEREEALLHGRFNSDLLWRDTTKAAETVGVETVEGKECYKVVLTPKAGKPITKWFDKDSNLLVKIVVTSKTPMGDIQSDSVMSDYRKEGEILVPHKIVTHVSTVELVATVDSLQYNVDIPEDKFAIPDEVKPLVKKADK